jgi:ATP-binding cassette, subfamily A (ABC1), member 3
VTAADITFLLLEALFYFALTLLIERLRAEPWIAALVVKRPRWWGFWRRRQRRQQQPQSQGAQADGGYHPLADGGEEEEGGADDADVRAEAARVAAGASRSAGDVVRLEALRKVYQTPRGPKVAVRALSFGIPRGECFGFLGVNGAGKTTTLSMLSGEFPPTSGGAFVAGFSITREQGRLRQCIGYCPQFSALIDALTVREHLELFARIKGIPEPQVAARVAGKMGEMDLVDFADKAAGSLSGGNQRKLSVAIATISDPPVLFLDGAWSGVGLCGLAWCRVAVWRTGVLCACVHAHRSISIDRSIDTYRGRKSRIHPNNTPPSSPPLYRAVNGHGPREQALYVGRHLAHPCPRQLHHPHYAQHVRTVSVALP